MKTTSPSMPSSRTSCITAGDDVPALMATCPTTAPAISATHADSGSGRVRNRTKSWSGR